VQLEREQIIPSWIEARDGELGGVSEAEPRGEALDGDGGGDDEPGARGAALAFADCAGRQIVPEQQRRRLRDAARWPGRLQGALPRPLPVALTLAMAT
jgi:hypothetical protein